MRLGSWVLCAVLALMITAPAMAFQPGGKGAPGGGKGPGGPGGPGVPGGFPGGQGMSPEMMQGMMKQALARFDKNGDGQISPEERKAAQDAMSNMMGQMNPQMKQQVEAMKKRADVNGDGQLDQQEMMMMQRQMQQMFGAGGLGGAGGGGGPRGGVGGPGGLGGPAGGPGGESPEGGKKKKVSAAIKRFDKDGDGVLNDEEKAAAQEQLKKGKK